MLSLPVDGNSTRVSDKVLHDWHLPQRVLCAKAHHPRGGLYEAERVSKAVAMVEAEESGRALRWEVFQSVALRRRVEYEARGAEDHPYERVEQRDRVVGWGR
eukprot:scaffold239950_cov33-Tisochrysis_lutea.AAC.3